MWIDITIQTAPFDLATEEQRLRAAAPGAGAVSLFQGIVRPGGESAKLAALVLEHYPGVTEYDIQQLVQQVAIRWPVLACRIVHRVGRLFPSEPIVLILVASLHRSAAFAATQYLIDRLKTQASFWKCEEYDDGTRRWL